MKTFLRLIGAACSALCLTQAAQAAPIVETSFEVPPYIAGAINGQNPVEPGFTTGWSEQNGANDYVVAPTGLSIPANGTVGAVNGGNWKIVENGTGSFFVDRYNLTGFTGTESELWLRMVLKPTAANSFTSFGIAPGKNIGLYGSASNFYLYNGISGSTPSTTLIPNVANLLLVKAEINRAAGQNDVLKMWVNPSSFSDLTAGINYTSILVGNNFEGNQSIQNILFNWENSKTEADLLMISSTLQDAAQPVPAPLSALGAASGFAFSRRLRQRIRHGRGISQPMA